MATTEEIHIAGRVLRILLNMRRSCETEPLTMVRYAQTGEFNARDAARSHVLELTRWLNRVREFLTDDPVRRVKFLHGIEGRIDVTTIATLYNNLRAALVTFSTQAAAAGTLAQFATACNDLRQSALDARNAAMDTLQLTLEQDMRTTTAPSGSDRVWDGSE